MPSLSKKEHKAYLDVQWRSAANKYQNHLRLGNVMTFIAAPEKLMCKLFSHFHIEQRSRPEKESKDKIYNT
jgi:hypothetical protein